MNTSTVRAATVVVVLLGFWIRFIAAGGELWLDEVWSMEVIRGLGTWLDVYRDPRMLDGHSSLFSLYLWFMRGSHSAALLRLPSVLASCALLLLFVLDAKGEMERLGRAVFGASSYVWCLYGTEARGYSGALLAGFAAWMVFKGMLVRPTKGGAILWGALVSLAFLFHYSFIFLVLAFLGAAACAAFERRAAWLEWALGCFVIVATVGGVYGLVVRSIPEGISPPTAYLDVITNTLSIMIGGPIIAGAIPSSVVIGFLCAGILCLVIGMDLMMKNGFKQPRAIFFLILFVLSPLLILAVKQPKVLFPRYFLSWSPFIISALAIRFCRGISAKRVGEYGLLGLLGVVWASGNGYYLWGLAHNGRGGYRTMLKEIQSKSPAEKGPVEISTQGSLHDMFLVRHYAEEIGLAATVKSLTEGEPQRWLLLHSVGPIPSNQLLPRMGPFEHRDSYWVSGLSGVSLHLYERTEEPAESVPPQNIDAINNALLKKPAAAARTETGMEMKSPPLPLGQLKPD